MRTPKILEKFAQIHGMFIEHLVFDKTNKGFVIVDADNNEILEIAPVYYSNGDRWKLNARGETGLLYLKSLRQLFRDGKPVLNLKQGWTGFKFTSLTTGGKGRLLPYGIIEKR